VEAPTDAIRQTQRMLPRVEEKRIDKKIGLEQRPEDHADQDRGDMVAGLARDIADHAEHQGQIHVEDVVARYESTDQREGYHQRDM